MNSHSIDLPDRSWKRSAVWTGVMTLYCASLFFAVDCVYSRLFYEKDRSGRVAHEYYHHGLLPNFQGYESWGPLRVKIYTNSIGFKDGRIREVSATTDVRRIILIGDSITEGIGLKFQDTFAGLLYRAGQEQNKKIEFLNAGVVSYSPVIYHKKIKYLLDAGLHFDEVVVFSDISDVQDESTSYFCIDAHLEFRQHCQSDPAPPSAPPSLSPPVSAQEAQRPEATLEDYFVITARLLRLKWSEAAAGTGRSKKYVSSEFDAKRAGWTKPGFDAGNSYDPLGIEGGINRSISNMQALAELLRSRGLSLTVVVYPCPAQLLENDRHSRQVQIWRDFCATNCKNFIDLFPAIFAEKDARGDDWYAYLFIPGDVHYSARGNRILFNALAQHLL